MVFEIKDKELAGRIGKLVTKTKTIETPAFFPVINILRQERDVPIACLLYTSPSPRDLSTSRMPSSA